MIGFKVCPICGKYFYTTSGTKKYCGPVCKAKARYNIDRTRLLRIKEEDKNYIKKMAINRNVPKVSIEEIAIEADKMGLSYGEYVARYLG